MLQNKYHPTPHNWLINQEQSWQTSFADRVQSRKKYFKNAELTLRRMLGSSHQVTKIEYVVRSDLAQRFQRFVPFSVVHLPSLTICSLYSKFVQFVQQYGDDAGPTMCFHGTNLDSILNGLMVPGQVTRQGQHVGVACGSTWGRSIYLAIALEPSFSLGYVRAAANMKALIVCSVLLGKSFSLAGLFTSRRLQKYPAAW